MKAYVKSLNISEKTGVVKHPVEKVTLREGHGIVGDAHAGDWHRQISLLGEGSIQKMKDKGIDGLEYGSFAENLTTVGIDLYTLEVGTIFKIGETVQELTQIGKKCHVGCAIAVDTGACIMPKEGIFTRVIKGGDIHVGDEIIIVEQ